MKAVFKISILVLSLALCLSAGAKPKSKKKGKDAKPKTTKTTSPEVKTFKFAKNCPQIADTALFINELKSFTNLEVEDNAVSAKSQQISYYKKVKLFGSEAEYIFIEYQYKNALKPNTYSKHQVLLAKDGRLVQSFQASDFQLVEILPKQYPFLMLLYITADGIGGHSIYKLKDEALESVYDGYTKDGVISYDANEDNKVYDPFELEFVVYDYNMDGTNDISFRGKTVYIQGLTRGGVWVKEEVVMGKTISYSLEHPFKTEEVKFIYVYDKESGKFVPVTDYSK